MACVADKYLNGRAAHHLIDEVNRYQNKSGMFTGAAGNFESAIEGILILIINYRSQPYLLHPTLG
jgi:hypothetical protein